MAGNIKVGGNTIFTHTGAVGAGTVTLKDQSGNAILTDDGTAVSMGNLRLPTTGGIKDSSGSNILTESGGNVSVGNATLASSVTFPAGHIVQTVFNTHDSESSFSSNTPTAVANLTKAITLQTSNPYILVILALNSVGKLSSNTSLGVRLTANDSGSLDIKLSDMLNNDDSSGYNFSSGFQAYLHNLTSDSSGTTITYTPKFYSAANSASAYINANFADGGQHSQIILMEIQK